jgi:2-dehydropantoate 2-reductase
MRVCVIGAGAMGGIFGGLLAKAGHDVTFVDTWREHVEVINAKGLLLDGVKGELVVRARAATEPPPGLAADVAVILTDANSTAQAAAAAATVLGRDGFAITFQNGIGNVEALVETLGAARVAAGSTMCSGATRGPGRSSFTHMGTTSIGEIGGGGSPRLDRFCTELAAAGLEAQVHSDIMSLIWTKFALNCSINALAAATGLRAGEFSRVPATDRLQDILLDEILAVARAKGITLTDPDFRAKVKTHSWKKYNRPSMLQHVESGRRTEIDALNARLVDEGRRLGVPTPYNDALVCILKGVEHKRRVIGTRTEAEYAALEAEAAHEPQPAARREN